MRQEILRMEQVGCTLHGVTQLRDFNLSIFAGEIMGLLPVDTHGLTALLDILSSNTPLSHGYVYYKEICINTWKTGAPRNNRIGLIRSKSCLVEGLTVADNVFVLKPGFRGHIIRSKLLHHQLTPWMQRMGLSISADTCISELTAFERVATDLLKAVVSGCRLIVMQDISAHLSETELHKIHELMQYYTEQGISFLYIAFHLEELLQLCHRVALMDQGTIVKILPQDTNIYHALQSYTTDYDNRVKRELSRPKIWKWEKPVFEAQAVSGSVVNDLSFSVASGECLVLQDLDNQVFGDILAMLTNIHAPETGGFFLDGKPYQPCIGKEVALIQELPIHTMLFPQLSVLDNLCFTLDHRIPGIWHNHRLKHSIFREYASLLGEDFFAQRVDALTTIQKYQLIYHRIALQKPKVVFCVQPFRRADLSLRMHIWELLKMLLDKDIALVILAVNLADSLSLADRLIRIQNTRPAEQYMRSEFSRIPISAPWLHLYREHHFARE